MVQRGNNANETMQTIINTELFLAEAAVAAPASHGRKPATDRRSGDVPALARRCVS